MTTTQPTFREKFRTLTARKLSAYHSRIKDYHECEFDRGIAWARPSENPWNRSQNGLNHEEGIR